MALSTTVPPTFDEKDLVNFGPLTTKFSCLLFQPPKINSARDFGQL